MAEEVTEDQLKWIAKQLRKPEGEQSELIVARMNEGNALINLNTINAIPFNDGDTVAEIGMANGFFVKDVLIKAKGLHYVGVDYSVEMVDAAIAYNKQWNNASNIRFLEGAAHRLPLTNHSVDHIFTVNTIYFWEDVNATLAEFRRVLKPGGSLTIGMREKRQMEKYPMTKYGFNMFDSKDIATRISASGFNKVEILEMPEPNQDIAGEKIEVTGIIIKCQS